MMKAKLHTVRNNPAFSHRYLDPIDKKWTYCSKDDSVCFGAVERFMGRRDKVVAAILDLEKMEVREA